MSNYTGGGDWARLSEGRLWSPQEVITIMRDVLAGLQYAASQVGTTKAMYCSDFSPRNVDYRGELVKVRHLHSASGVDYESLQPRFLSPEMRQIFSNWVLRGAEAIDSVDLGAASVFSVAILALTLLSPAVTQGVLTCEGLEEVLRGTELTEGLKKVLEGMLMRTVEQRISLHSALKLLELLAADSAVFTISTFNDLVRENQLQEAFIVLTMTKGLNLRAEVNLLCSNCGNLIFTSEPLAVTYCLKHIFCSIQCYSAACSKAGKADNSICPLCESKPSLRRIRIQPKAKNSIKRCETCQREFEPNTTDPWRLDLLGSSLFSKAQSVCSKACMGQPSEPVRVSNPVVSPGPVIRTNPVISAFVKSVPIYNARSRVLEDAYYQLDEESKEELRSSGEVHTQGTMMKMFAPNQRCHLCRNQLLSSIQSRLIVCSKNLAVVCSVDCVRNLSDTICPSCGGEIDSASVASALGQGDPLCQNCGDEVRQRPVCGHSFCQRCIVHMEICVLCANGQKELISLFQQVLFRGPGMQA